MIPIHFKNPKPSEPPTDTHYIVASNGFFLHKKMWWVDAVVPVKEIMVLDRESPSARLLLPKLPAEILAKALLLCKAVFGISGSEACLLLHYTEAMGYQLTVPKQRVSPGGIEYDASERIPNAKLVGTIHSHGKFEAYRSMIDDGDEKHLDGVHIIVGDIDLYPQFSLSAQIVVNGIPFPANYSWFEGIWSNDYKMWQINHLPLNSWEVPVEWLQMIEHLSTKTWRRRKETL
jgi:PRTRC genetic system protein A